jgi:hypothetical protein
MTSRPCVGDSVINNARRRSVGDSITENISRLRADNNVRRLTGVLLV